MKETAENQPLDTSILDLTEAEVKKMSEDLILTGFCTYSFKISGLPVVLKSLTWDQQTKLSTAIASIPKQINVTTEAERPVTVNEFNNKATELTVLAYLDTIGDKKVKNFSNLSANLVRTLAESITKFIHTIDVKLITVDNLKN